MMHNMRIYSIGQILSYLLMPLWHSTLKQIKLLYVHTYVYFFFQLIIPENPVFWYIICIK